MGKANKSQSSIEYNTQVVIQKMVLIKEELYGKTFSEEERYKEYEKAVRLLSKFLKAQDKTEVDQKLLDDYERYFIQTYKMHAKMFKNR